MHAGKFNQWDRLKFCQKYHVHYFYSAKLNIYNKFITQNWCIFILIRIS